jgi:hypothetical protein
VHVHVILLRDFCGIFGSHSFQTLLFHPRSVLGAQFGGRRKPAQNQRLDERARV